MGKIEEPHVEAHRNVEDEGPTSWNPIKVFFLMLVNAHDHLLSQMLSNANLDIMTTGSW